MSLGTFWTMLFITVPSLSPRQVRASMSSGAPDVIPHQVPRAVTRDAGKCGLGASVSRSASGTLCLRWSLKSAEVVGQRLESGPMSFLPAIASTKPRHATCLVGDLHLMFVSCPRRHSA